MVMYGTANSEALHSKNKGCGKAVDHSIGRVVRDDVVSARHKTATTSADTERGLILRHLKLPVHGRRAVLPSRIGKPKPLQ